MTFYHRQFTRTPGPDVDILADDAFLKANFVDFFGQWLQQDQNAAIDSLDGLLTAFFNKQAITLKIFIVADGSFVTERPAGDWFDPHIRIIAIAYKGSDPFLTDPAEWTLFMVGSSLLKSSDRYESFLQVASWNGLEFRFYQHDIVNVPEGDSRNTPIQAWNYFGASMDAFGPNSYLGPFNGHVNGACIMKELHKPWLHWFTNNSNFTKCFSSDDLALFKTAPYLTRPGGVIFTGGAVQDANVLEGAIKPGVDRWYERRKKMDFFSADGNDLASSPTNIPRWVSHLLLTTTINIVTALPSNTRGFDFDAPGDNFYDSELLSSYGSELLDSVSSTTFPFKKADYTSAVQALGLALLQEVDGPPYPEDVVQFHEGTRTLGGGKETAKTDQLAFVVVAEHTEGEFPFNILQSSFEDSEGVGAMQKLIKTGRTFSGLFSKPTFYAIMMLDFWNPIYSWKRGILMQYVPQSTTLNGNRYDLDTAFINNVKASSYAKSKDSDSPEVQFLNLLEVDLSVHQENVAKYLQVVSKKIRTASGLLDYMKLAESRRRIYRPLPLDEFGFTLPYAMNVPWDAPWLEMQFDGSIKRIDPRGVEFLTSWTSTLAGVDPQVIPVSTSADSSGKFASPPLPISSLPRPSMLSVSCQRTTQASSKRKVQGCPCRVGTDLLHSRISFAAVTRPISE